MARMTTPSFICELPLVLVSDDERRLLIRLDCARQVYNAVLGESQCVLLLKMLHFVVHEHLFVLDVL